MLRFWIAARATDDAPTPESFAVPLTVRHDRILLAADGLATVTFGPTVSTTTVTGFAAVLALLPLSSTATTLGANVPAAL